MLLLTGKLNLKCYVLEETKELLSIIKMYITIINILIFIISIAIVFINIIIIIIIINITIINISIIIAFFKSVCMLNQTPMSCNSYVIWLLTSKKINALFLFTFSLFKSCNILWMKIIWAAVFNKYFSVLKSDLFKNTRFDWNETISKYVQINIFTGKTQWWRLFKYYCKYEGFFQL